MSGLSPDASRGLRWVAAVLLACILGAVPCPGAESSLTAWCEGELFRGLNMGRFSRSSLELGVVGVYDDGTRLHARVDGGAIADHALPERDRVFLREGIIGLGFDRMELSLGRRILTVGRLDVLQPANFFLRRNLSDPIEYRREPVWTAQTALSVHRVTLTLTWLPLFEPDVLSWDAGNPWSLFPETIDYPGLEDFTADYRKGRRIEPEEGIRSSEYAVQMDWYAGRWDIGMIGARGYSRLPTWLEPASIEEYPDGRVVVELDTVHRPIVLAGLDFARVAGSVTLRGELAHTWVAVPADRPESRAYLTGGASIEYSRPHVPVGKNLSVSAQYNFDGAANEGAGYTDYQHFFRHAGLVRVLFEPARDMRVELESFINLEDTDRYVKLECAVTPLVGLQSLVGLVLVHGPHDSFLGRFRAHDRFRLMMRYTWATRFS